MTLTEQHKKWMRRIGIPLGALLVFVYALHLTFPYERLEQTARDSLTEFWDVESLEISPGWLPGHVKVSNVVLKTRPTHEGDKPIEMTVDSADVSIGLFAAMTGGLAVDVDADIGDGEIEAEYRASSSEASIDIQASAVPIGALPGVKDVTGGVPLEGNLDLAFAVTLPKGKWKDAEGSMTFSCDGCTVGDGVAKIRPSAPGQVNAFSEGGLTLPKLKLGKLEGEVAIKKGLGKLDKFDAKSPDGELYLEGEIKFDDPFKRSNLTAYLRFKASEALKQRESKIADMEMMMGGAGRRPDGTIGVKVGPGAVTALRFVTTKNNPLEAGKKNDKAGRPTPSRTGSGTGITALGGPAAMEQSSPPMGEGEPVTPPPTTATHPNVPAGAAVMAGPEGHEPPVVHEGGSGGPPDAPRGAAQPVGEGAPVPQQAPPPPPPEEVAPPPPPPPAEQAPDPANNE